MCCKFLSSGPKRRIRLQTSLQHSPERDAATAIIQQFFSASCQVTLEAACLDCSEAQFQCTSGMQFELTSKGHWIASVCPKSHRELHSARLISAVESRSLSVTTTIFRVSPAHFIESISLHQSLAHSLLDYRSYAPDPQYASLQNH